jgi:hypothetical protein
MIVCAHQPIFLPWPGFFHKAAHADRVVLLDDVQFPRGRSWLNRNRLKNEVGELWLTVPVMKKGLGLQAIREVEVYTGVNWRRKHLGGIRQNYVHAPYFADYYWDIEAIYGQNHSRLAEITTELIGYLMQALSIRTEVLQQSSLGISGKGTDLFINICRQLGADRFLALSSAEKFIDRDAMARHGIEVVRALYRPMIYPQLWGDFVCNLSVLDLLFNCGPRSREIVMQGSWRGGAG